MANPVITIAITLHQTVIPADSSCFRIPPYAALEIHSPKGNPLIPEIKYPPVYYKPILPHQIAIQPVCTYPPTGERMKIIWKYFVLPRFYATWVKVDYYKTQANGQLSLVQTIVLRKAQLSQFVPGKQQTEQLQFTYNQLACSYITSGTANSSDDWEESAM